MVLVIFVSFVSTSLVADVVRFAFAVAVALGVAYANTTVAVVGVVVAVAVVAEVSAHQHSAPRKVELGEFWCPAQTCSKMGEDRF